MPEQPHAPRARPQLCSSSSTSISQSPSPSKAPLLIIHNNLHAPVESRTRIRPMPAGELQLPVNSQSTAGFDSIETTFISRFRIALHHDCRLGNGRSQVIRTQNRSRIALDRKHKQYWIARRTTLQLSYTVYLGHHKNFEPTKRKLSADDDNSDDTSEQAPSKKRHGPIASVPKSY